MAERAGHCPFLNQTDSRCAEHHKLEQLSYAFHYCFGAYLACPVYAELLSARTKRRMAAKVTDDLAHADIHTAA